MTKRGHKRSRTTTKKIAAGAAALLLGGGGLAAANVYASAGTSDGTQDGLDRQAVSTIQCPDVASELSGVPDGAREDVNRSLARLDRQVRWAYLRMRQSQQAIADDPGYADNAILDPLKSKRTAVLDRIATALNRSDEGSEDLSALAQCELKENISGPRWQRQADTKRQVRQQPAGPSRGDFIDIRKVRPNFTPPKDGPQASTGRFFTECGANENGLFNSDNVIVAPGVRNGAQHNHDYVGNQGNDAFSSNEDLAAAETTCTNPEDQSSYFWPVLRLQNGQQEEDANKAGGGKDGNIGPIQAPETVTLSFEGNPQGKVTAMPRFLRIITGDAKAFTNGTDNANASWSCTGFENRQLTDKYPLCPEGSQLVRTFRFQSCWDGKNTDSADHRSHIAFANEDGSCDDGFQAIPQMVQRVTYDLPRGTVFAIDSFPEQLHKPVTDHGDFINVMSDDLNQRVAECVNNGLRCRNN